MTFFCNGSSLRCSRLKTRVPARHTTKKKEIRGIFVHAEVIPGYDWQQPPGEGMNSRELRFLGETKSQTENLGLRLRALAHLYMEASALEAGPLEGGAATSKKHALSRESAEKFICALRRYSLKA